ncbi:unnamed protein product [Microthlaspi erraticum]|uniref:Histone deacetylase interacting domain-containing protein n=1 Tax=Microthlaspi erraticum TaxID=1685480 RepID=A0A6D2J2Y9_9BRAS|nr:unnamed protein product [Microthlaspi erraticum]
MVVSRDPTKHEYKLYHASLRKILHEKSHKEFVQVLRDIKAAPRGAGPSHLARIEEILKDHPQLLLGFISFFTKAMIGSDVPPDPNKGLGPFQTMVGKRVSPSPVLTMDAALDYMDEVKKAFHDEPAKYDQFIEILLTAHTVDEADSALARVKELMIGHMDLFLVFSVILAAQPKTTIPPETATAPPPKKKRRRAKRVAKPSHLARIEEILKITRSCFFTEDMIGSLIPPDPNRGLAHLKPFILWSAKEYHHASSVITMDGALDYMDDVQEASHDEPVKHDQYREILLTAHTVTGFFVELMKQKVHLQEWRNSVVLAAQPKITIPPHKKKRKRAKRY